MKNKETFVKIFVPNSWVSELATQFDVSAQTVRNALIHFNNSIKAQAIRREAKIRLLHEAEKIKD